MRLRYLSICSLAAIGLAVGRPALAQSLSDSQILQQFNAIVFGNFSTTADVEGRTVIGGNMTGGATFALNLTNEAVSSFAALNVYGSETSTGSFNIDNGAGLNVAGSNAGNFALNGGGSVYVGSTNTGNLSSTGGSASIGIVGSNSGQLTLNQGGSITTGAGNSGVVNISGGTGTLAINGNNTSSVTLNNGGTVKIHGNTGNVTLNGGSLTYSGKVTGNLNLNGGATSKHGSVSITAPSNPLPSFTSTFQTPLTALSSQLAALTPNSTVLINGNNVTLSAAPNGSGVAVLDVNTSVFSANRSITVALNGANSFIINLSVAGCTSNCSFTFPNSVNFLNPTSYASSVLWNVVDINNLSFTNEFGGTVLAPETAVTNGGPLDGTLIASMYTGSGELHANPYTGKLPIPEPTSLAMFGVALAGIGGARRWATQGKRAQPL